MWHKEKLQPNEDISHYTHMFINHVANKKKNTHIDEPFFPLCHQHTVHGSEEGAQESG